MSLFKSIANMARRSNERSFDRIEAHERKVSDGRCCHCSNCSYVGNIGAPYYCTKHGWDISYDEYEKYGCKQFSPQSISPFDL